MHYVYVFRVTLRRARNRVGRNCAPHRAGEATVNDVDESLGVPAPEVSTVELGDELSVFHAATGDALSLNRTAADLFALADGSTTISEAVSVLARAYGVAAEDIAGDVDEAVRLLREAGVLVAAQE